MTLRRVLLIANVGAGSAPEEDGARRERVEAAFAACGVELIARWLPGSELAAAVRGAASLDVDAVVAAGGDGTINTVARALAGSGMPLGIVPCGTLNHFAKDLGLPLDPEGAAKVIAAGHVRHVDLGEVNGRLFLNNSSIGAYPAAVEDRERLRARGRRKWSAMAVAAVRTRRRFMPRHLRLDLGRARVVQYTPAVLIANNAYRLTGAIGRRDALDGGRLWCYVTPRRGFPRLARMAMHALYNKLDESPELVALPVPALTVRCGARRLPVSLDGEIARLTPPLHYRIRPRHLAVLAPAPATDR